MKATHLKHALLGSGAALAMLAVSLPASASDIDEMRAQIQALQDKIAKIEVQEQHRVAPAAAVEAGSKPKSWKLPGTNTSMNIGGFAILQFDYDLNGQSGAYGPATAPVDGTTGARRQGEFDMNARQSRIFVSTSTPTDWGDLQTLIEFDMNGTGGSAPASAGAEYNSNQGAALRMRKAYGQLGPVLAGQDTTTFFTPGAGERTDVATPFLGSSAFRLGMVRYTHSFGGGTMLQVAIEDNVVNGDTAAAGAVLGANTNQGRGVSNASISGLGPNLHKTPAFVGQLSHNWSSGSAGLALMGRQLSVDNAGSGAPGALHDSTVSWGLSAGAGWIISKQFRAGAQFLYGKSLGIYSGGESVLVTATGPQNNFAIDNVGVIGGAAFLQWRFTDTLRTNVLYGREDYDYDLQKNEITSSGATAGTSVIGYTQMIAANVMWEPVPAVNIGLQYEYTIVNVINNSNAKASRLELAFRYSF